MLQVTFARLPGVSVDDLPALDEALARQARGLRTVLVQSGWLPVLSIGLVARAGRVVGQLGANVLPFVFDSKAHTARVKQMRLSVTPSQDVLIRYGRARRARASFENLGDEDLPGERPLWTDPSSHPMLDVIGGRMLSIGGESRGPPGHLLLPCPEIARVMYASHRALAAALLDDSWHRANADVFDLERTRKLKDGSWEVAPRVPLAGEHLALAGNLLFNRVASRRANLLRYWITSEPSGGRLSANFPFDWDRLEMTVACFPVPLPGPGSGTAWFGHEIVGVRWPDPPLGPPRRIVSIPPRDNRQGKDRQPSSDRGFPGRAKGVPPDGNPEDAVQDHDPGEGTEVTVVEVAGTVWTNGPVVERAPKPASHIRPSRAPLPASEPATGLSAGRPTSRMTGVAPADPQARDRLGGSQAGGPTFERVVAMLDALVTRGAIMSHAAVPDPGNPTLHRGEVPAWPFPVMPITEGKVTRRWYVRDFPNRAAGRTEVRRAAMLRSIRTSSGLVHWIETEQRNAGESFHSLVFAGTREMHLEGVVRALLKIAASRSGVWPKPEALLASLREDISPGIHAAHTWRHVALGRANVAASSQPKAARPELEHPFNSASALAVIRAVGMT